MLNQELISIGKLKTAYRLNAHDADALITALASQDFLDLYACWHEAVRFIAIEDSNKKSIYAVSGKALRVSLTRALPMLILPLMRSTGIVLQERTKEQSPMPYTPIAIDREALTIMGVPFPDLEALESTADAIGSNMFEGYQPTKKGIEIIRDYTTGKITFAEFIRAAVDKSYAE